MNSDSKDFLKRLVETPSPSGYEYNVQKLVRERIQPWCDNVRTDVMGNVFGTRNAEGSPRIMLADTAIRSGSLLTTSPTMVSPRRPDRRRRSGGRDFAARVDHDARRARARRDRAQGDPSDG
jgi:hypothetical protein